MWLNLLIGFLLVVYVVDCLFMGLVILMQRSKQEGLGAAFGGGVTDAIWGAQTSQVLVKATVVAAALFFFLSISLARLYSMRESAPAPTSSVQSELEKSSAVTPAATNAAPMTPPAPVVPSATTTPVSAQGGTASLPATAPTATATPVKSPAPSSQH
jgi:preprotein translocase subunit SecG